MDVEQTNFVTHLIITIQLYYWLSKSPSVKIWSNKFQMVMISYSKLCASLWENLMSEFYVNWRKVKFYGCIQTFMLPWKLRKRQILPVNQNLSSAYFSPAKFQLVSCNLSLAMIWQMTYTHKLPKLCSATLIKQETLIKSCKSSNLMLFKDKWKQGWVDWSSSNPRTREP